MSNDDPKRGPDGPATRLSRRILVMSGLVATPALAAPAAEGPARAPGAANQLLAQGRTDSDPSDGAGRGRGTPRGSTGRTDSDPNDGPGNGRGAAPRGNTGRTDSDPNDGAGAGRGAPRRSTGI
ncbi:MAG: hypothetical protein V4653_18930, partial [Pseudomonadota bacterium]